MKNLEFTISSGDAVSSRLSCAGVNMAGKAERLAVLDCWGLSPAVLDWSLDGSEGWEEKDWIELTRTELLVLNEHIFIDWIWYLDFFFWFLSVNWLKYDKMSNSFEIHEPDSWSRFMNQIHEPDSCTRFMIQIHEPDSCTRFMNNIKTIFYYLNYRVKRFLEADEWSTSRPPWPAAWRSWTPTPANLFVSDPPRCRDCGSMIECNLDPETWTWI